MNVSVKQLPELKKRRLTSLQQQLPNFSTGASGEERAIQFLKAKNFQIVDTNVRVGLHEVDIIACAPQLNTHCMRQPLAATTHIPGIQPDSTPFVPTTKSNPVVPETHILVFCEVKTRSTSFFGNPSQAVSLKKLKSMQQVARAYLRQHHWAGEYRFDVLAVLPKEIEHFENVTWWQ